MNPEAWDTWEREEEASKSRKELEDEMALARWLQRVREGFGVYAANFVEKGVRSPKD